MNAQLENDLVEYLLGERMDKRLSRSSFAKSSLTDLVVCSPYPIYFVGGKVMGF